MQVTIEPSWKEQLTREFEEPYFADLASFVRTEYEQGTVYPHPKNIFSAFSLTPFNKVKVVILGQDPYHGPHQANGLSFSVPPGVRNPPSLRNIFCELADDLGTPLPDSGDLSAWAREGVLLLNATLTVRAGAPGSHQGQGWERFTDAVITALSKNRSGIVFILWGAYARSKKKLIDETRHCIIESPHPSPLSAHAGFFGSKPFSRTNDYLRAHGATPINWLSIFERAR